MKSIFFTFNWMLFLCVSLNSFAQNTSDEKTLTEEINDQEISVSTEQVFNFIKSTFKERKDKKDSKSPQETSENRTQKTPSKKDKKANAPKEKPKEYYSDVEVEGMVKDILRTNITERAFDYQNVKYRYGGESPYSGFDCSGLTQYVFDKEDISLPRTSKQQSKKGKLVKNSEAQKGDLVFFGRSKNNINHVGIIVSEPGEPLMMIHASSSQGVTVSNLNTSKYWKKRLRFIKRVI